MTCRRNSERERIDCEPFARPASFTYGPGRTLMTCILTSPATRVGTDTFLTSPWPSLPWSPFPNVYTWKKPSNIYTTYKKKLVSACHALQSTRIAPRPRPMCPAGLHVSEYVQFCRKSARTKREKLAKVRKFNKHTYIQITDTKYTS